MAKRKSIFRRIKLVYKRSSNVTKIVVLLAIVLSTATLLILGAAIREANAREEKARQEAAALEQQKEDLKDKIDDLGSIEGIKDIAKDELGLVDPDTVVMTPSKGGSANNDPGDPQSPVFIWIFCIVAVAIAVPVTILVIRKKRQPNPKFAAPRD